jgi:hypothetical protein
MRFPLSKMMAASNIVITHIVRLAKLGTPALFVAFGSSASRYSCFRAYLASCAG